MTAARTVWLALGGNLGNRRQNLRVALTLLLRHGTLTEVAGLYLTAPFGPQDQPAFLNTACALNTVLSLPELLTGVKRIEWELGRRPAQVWGPRPLDIDILLAERETIDGLLLRIPHPRMHERAFVLAPLVEIAGGRHHPTLRATIAELYQVMPPGERDSVTRVAGPEWVASEGT